MDEERQMILRMLKEGKVSVEEAEALLQALDEERAADDVIPPGHSGRGPEMPEAPEIPEIPGIQIDVGKIMREIGESIPRDVLGGIRIGPRGKRSRWMEIVEGLSGLVERSAEIKGEAPMAPGETLELRNAWGDVIIRPSADGHMRFTAMVRAWGHVPEDAERILSSVVVRPYHSGTTVLLEVARVEGRRLRVDFQIEVPQGVGVRIHEAKGDLQIGSVRGPLSISLASGDVQISDQSGRVDLDVKSGDLTINRIDGDVSLDVKRGDVDLVDVQGQVRGRVISGDVQILQAGGASLDVVSGDVDIRDVAGEIEVESKSGDIDLRGIRPDRLKVRVISGDVAAAIVGLGQGEVTIEAVSGDIDVGLPPESRASIEAAVRSGEIDCALPLEPRRADRRSLSGMLNGGGVRIRLQAVNGDIDIDAYRGE